MRRSDLVLIMTWALVLLQLLTIAPGPSNVFLQPLSAEWGIFLAAFLVTGLGLLPGCARPSLVAAHLSVVGLLMLAHPLTTFFGRDGSLGAIALHVLAVLRWRTTLQPERKLLVASLLVALLLGEAALSCVHDPRPEQGLLDYGDLMGAYGEGGFLKPRLSVRAVGEHSPVVFITESHGFRNRHEVDRHKPSGARRVILIGDSFVVGYRVDQDETIGRVLENELRRRTGSASLKVLVAGAGHPGVTLDLLQRHLLDFDPDLVLVGITLGNDISQSWLERRKLPAKLLNSLLLPTDAFASGPLGRFPARADRSLRHWRIYRRAAQELQTEVITPWYFDEPGRAHLFDPGHSLGHFFARRSLALVERSFDDLFFFMDGIARAAAARHTPVVFALLPQRFQVRQREWSATLWHYALDAGAFDVDRPNRLIRDACVQRGLVCVDLLPAFRRGCAMQPCYMSRGDMHWNARGHWIAARAIAEDLIARGCAGLDSNHPRYAGSARPR
jgi:hypothetical protein